MHDGLVYSTKGRTFLSVHKAAVLRVIRSRLAELRRSSLAIRPEQLSIAKVSVSEGCRHSCAFCMRDTSKQVSNISTDTVLSARKKYPFTTDVFLTGGEPLDHSDIVELVSILGASIPFTNGFSSGTEASRWLEVLEGIDHAIRGVSFHASNKPNPGRVAVASHLLLAGRSDIEWGIRTMPNKEIKTVLRLFDFIIDILTSIHIQNSSMYDDKIKQAILSLPFISGWYPLIKLVKRIGRAGNQQEALSAEIIPQPAVYQYRLIRELPCLTLDSHGNLLSYLFDEWLGDVVIGSIKDNPDVICKRLIAESRWLLDQQLATLSSSEEEQLGIIIRNHELSASSQLRVLDAFKDVEVISRINHISELLAELGISNEEFTLLCDSLRKSSVSADSLGYPYQEIIMDTDADDLSDFVY